MRATVKLTLQKSKPWLQSPHYLTPKNENEKLQAEGGGVNGKGHYGVLGVDKDLREASRKAVRGMVEWLVGEKGLAREEGYMLCSVAGDLKIAEAVDMPHYAVACSLPLSVFVGAPYV
jgi:acetamidase/formamidase